MLNSVVHWWINWWQSIFSLCLFPLGSLVSSQNDAVKLIGNVKCVNECAWSSVMDWCLIQGIFPPGPQCSQDIQITPSVILGYSHHTLSIPEIFQSHLQCSRYIPITPSVFPGYSHLDLSFPGIFQYHPSVFLGYSHHTLSVPGIFRSHLQFSWDIPVSSFSVLRIFQSHLQCSWYIPIPSSMFPGYSHLDLSGPGIFPSHLQCYWDRLQSTVTLTRKKHFWKLHYN